MLTEQEVRSLLADHETDLVERKERAQDLEGIRQAICAYANDLPNHRKCGVVIVGQADDGACTGLQPDDRLLTTLGGLRSDGKILPFPVIQVGRLSLDDGEVAIVVVEPSDNPPVRVNGRTWIRVGPRRATATFEEEKRLTEKRRWGLLPFDAQPVIGASVQDLDVARFVYEYLPAALPPDILEENQRASEDQMRALRLLKDDVPTVIGILLIGTDPRTWLPGAYIQFVRFDGNEVTDSVKDQMEISGNLADQLRRADDKMEAHIEVAARQSAQGTEIRSPTYPIRALRELLRNAIVHRTYEATSSPVRVNWFNDRIEITNPGGLFGAVTPENFGKPSSTDYRNPTVAEWLKYLGFVQRFGMGIAVAQNDLQRNGNPQAEFLLDDPARVMVVVRIN